MEEVEGGTIRVASRLLADAEQPRCASARCEAGATTADGPPEHLLSHPATPLPPTSSPERALEGTTAEITHCLAAASVGYSRNARSAGASRSLRRETAGKRLVRWADQETPHGTGTWKRSRSQEAHGEDWSLGEGDAAPSDTEDAEHRKLFAELVRAAGMAVPRITQHPGHPCPALTVYAFVARTPPPLPRRAGGEGAHRVEELCRASP